MLEELWCSWSNKGHIVASLLMNVLVEGIMPTTNHLESFNAVLKYKHISCFKHSGHCVRFDVFINILVTQIIPENYALRRAQQDIRDWMARHFRDAAGGINLVALRFRKVDVASKNNNAGLLWWAEDKARDHNAEVMSKVVGHIGIQRSDPDTIIASCASATAIITDPSHLRYQLELHHSRFGSCECKDF